MSPAVEPDARARSKAIASRRCCAVRQKSLKVMREMPAPLGAKSTLNRSTLGSSDPIEAGVSVGVCGALAASVPNAAGAADAAGADGTCTAAAGVAGDGVAAACVCGLAGVTCGVAGCEIELALSVDFFEPLPVTTIATIATAKRTTSSVRTIFRVPFVMFFRLFSDLEAVARQASHSTLRWP